VRENIKDFRRIELAKLVDAFKLFENIKDKELLNKLEERLLL
jgi:hypothetical protein